MGWNIVTGYLDSAGPVAWGFPNSSITITATTSLTIISMCSPSSGKAAGMTMPSSATVPGASHAEPDKVRAIGMMARTVIDADHLSEPSPRARVLYRGLLDARACIAAKHADPCSSGAPTRSLPWTSSQISEPGRHSLGRDRYDVKVFVGMSLVVGRTEKGKLGTSWKNIGALPVSRALAHFSSSSGVDFTKYDLDEPIQYEKNNANNSTLEAITKRSAGTVWTVRKLIDQMILGSRQKPFVGTPEQIADHIASWVDDADIDGINLPRTVAPESLADFVDLVVPVLQERGLFKADYADGTLREKLFGEAATVFRQGIGAPVSGPAQSRACLPRTRLIAYSNGNNNVRSHTSLRVGSPCRRRQRLHGVRVRAGLL